MDVVSFEDLQKKKQEKLELDCVKEIISTIVLPQLSIDEKIQLMTATENKDAIAFHTIIKPYLLRHKMRNS